MLMLMLRCALSDPKCSQSTFCTGEHTSQPLAPVQQQQQAATAEVVPVIAPSVRQQQSNDVPVTMVAEEAAGSPPGSVSPMYRANSLVSHTAAVPNLLKVRRLAAGETPASAPLLGSSPSTSKAEASGIPAPRSTRRPTGHHGGGAPVPRGGTAAVHLHTPLRFAGPPTGPPGPSQPSMSQTQGSGPLPSTLAVAMGGTPSIGFVTPVPMLPASTPLAGLSGIGQYGLGSPAPLQQVVAALMPPPGVTQPLQQQQQQQYIQQQPLPAASQQEQAAVATPMPAAQGSSLVVPPAQVAQLAALAAAHQATSTQAQAAEVTAGALQAGSEAPQTSAGAPSVLSMPSLVGNSAIQGHPLPLPIYGSVGGAATTLAEQTPLMALNAGAAAVPATVQSGAVEPASRLIAASPEPLAGTCDDTPRQVVLSLEQRAQQPATSWVMAAGPLHADQQAASMVEGRHSPANDDFAAAVEEAEAPLLPAEPQTAVIQELPVAEVMAASQQAHSGRAGAPEGREDIEVDGMTLGAAHGAASVMAAVVTQSDRRSDGDTGKDGGRSAGLDCALCSAGGKGRRGGCKGAIAPSIKQCRHAADGKRAKPACRRQARA